MRYVVLALLAAWLVINLFTRERRRRIDAGLQRASVVISLAFVAVGAVLLYRALATAGGDAGQAAVIILVGLILMVYQRWGR